MTVTIPIIGECDCCARGPRVLTICVAYGIETAACAECRGGTAREVIEELAEEAPEPWPVDVAAQICPVFRSEFMIGTAG